MTDYLRPAFPPPFGLAATPRVPRSVSVGDDYEVSGPSIGSVVMPLGSPQQGEVLFVHLLQTGLPGAVLGAIASSPLALPPPVATLLLFGGT